MLAVTTVHKEDAYIYASATPSNKITCSSPNYGDLEHRRIVVVAASITVHDDPDAIAAVLVRNNGVLRGVNHGIDRRILSLNHSFCLLALLPHQLRPGKLTPTALGVGRIVGKAGPVKTMMV